jgi:hypothetical protein
MYQTADQYYASFTKVETKISSQLNELRLYFSKDLGNIAEQNTPHTHIKILAAIMAIWSLTNAAVLTEINSDVTCSRAIQYFRPHLSEVIALLFILKENSK